MSNMIICNPEVLTFRLAEQPGQIVTKLSAKLFFVVADVNQIGLQGNLNRVAEQKIPCIVHREIIRDQHIAAIELLGHAEKF